jgi:SAM-dependent methyltransferase
MHPQAYATLTAVESSGWYYQARARCLRRLVARFCAADGQSLRILDVGCGTGGTSQALCRFGDVTGLEPSALAVELLHKRYPDMRVLQGSVDDLQSLVEPGSFDLATILGVLYHRCVADPAAALRQVHRALAGGGWLVWNEAVHPILARSHDEFVDAGRRFRPREMHALLAGAGFSVRLASHLVGWGFPIGLGLGVLHRAGRRLFGRRSFERHVSDDRPLPRPLNALLRELTYFEWRCTLGRLKMPLGVSYLAIAQKASR